MNNVMQKAKEKPILTYIIINILYLFMGNYLMHNLIIPMNVYAYGFSFVLLFSNIIVIFLLRKKYVKNKLDILLILIPIFLIISVIFAYNKRIAILGVDNRYEGLFMLLYYLTLMYIASYVQKEDKRKIIYLILGIGVYQFLYALCQKFEIMGVTLYDFKGQIYFSGITSNPNYFAAYMIMCAGSSLGLFIEEENKKRKIIFFILLIIFIIGLLMSDTLGCILAFAFILMYSIIYMIVKKKFKKLFVIVTSILSVTFILHMLGATTLIEDLKLFKNQTERLAIKHEVSYNMGSGRVYVWKKALDKAPNHLLTGIGIDNFQYILDGKPITRWEYYYDKAHNEYLQILITEGIITLILYLILYSVIVISGIKNSFKKNEIYLLLPVIGYLFQAFFGISVINIAPIFYIILGLCINRYKDGEIA